MKMKPLPSVKEIKARYSYDLRTGKFKKLVIWSANSGKFELLAKPVPYCTIDNTINFGDVKFLSSRIAWIYVHGSIPKNHRIVHLDRDVSNNRMSNLRCLNHKQMIEVMTETRANKSGCRGVYQDKRTKKWIAFIGIGAERLAERFWDFDDAVAWRKGMEKALHTVDRKLKPRTSH